MLLPIQHNHQQLVPGWELLLVMLEVLTILLILLVTIIIIVILLPIVLEIIIVSVLSWWGVGRLLNVFSVVFSCRYRSDQEEQHQVCQHL